MVGNQKGSLQYSYIENYVVFDLETTGINPNQDAIIEISAVRVRGGKKTDTFSTLVNPQRPIPRGATAVNHITNEMVANAPSLKEALPLFLEFIGEDSLVGHNIHSFDMKFIYKAVEAMYGKTISNDYIDTLLLTRLCLPILSRRRLVDLAAYFHISTHGAHRALQDCIMNQECYEQMRKMQKEQKKHVCPICGGSLQERKGRYGAFLGCSNFPQCRYTENCN